MGGFKRFLLAVIAVGGAVSFVLVRPHELEGSATPEVFELVG